MICMIGEATLLLVSGPANICFSNCHHLDWPLSWLICTEKNVSIIMIKFLDLYSNQNSLW